MTWLMLLFLAILIDGIIRMIYWGKIMNHYNDLIAEQKENVERTTQQVKEEINLSNKKNDEEIEKIKIQANTFWTNLLVQNLVRYGILGTLKYGDFDFSSQYKFVGTPTYLDVGIIKDKHFFSSDEIINNMANFIRNNPDGNVYSTSDAIGDKHLVEIYLPLSNREYIFDDKILYNNVKSGDEVTISHDNLNLLAVGFKLRGKKDDKMDVGRI